MRPKSGLPRAAVDVDGFGHVEDEHEVWALLGVVKEDGSFGLDHEVCAEGGGVDHVVFLVLLFANAEGVFLARVAPAQGDLLFVLFEIEGDRGRRTECLKGRRVQREKLLRRKRDAYLILKPAIRASFKSCESVYHVRRGRLRPRLNNVSYVQRRSKYFVSLKLKLAEISLSAP